VARRVLATCSQRSTSKPRAAGPGQDPLPADEEGGGPDARFARDPSSTFVPHSDHLMHPLSILSSGLRSAFGRPRSLPMKKRRPKACVFLSGFLCFFRLFALAQHSPPDVRINDMKREADAHAQTQRVPLLASHDASIIGGNRPVSRPVVAPGVRLRYRPFFRENGVDVLVTPAGIMM